MRSAAALISIVTVAHLDRNARTLHADTHGWLTMGALKFGAKRAGTAQLI